MGNSKAKVSESEGEPALTLRRNLQGSGLTLQCNLLGLAGATCSATSASCPSVVYAIAMLLCWCRCQKGKERISEEEEHSQYQVSVQLRLWNREFGILVLYFILFFLSERIWVFFFFLPLDIFYLDKKCIGLGLMVFHGLFFCIPFGKNNVIKIKKKQYKWWYKWAGLHSVLGLYGLEKLKPNLPNWQVKWASLVGSTYFDGSNFIFIEKVEKVAFL